MWWFGEKTTVGLVSKVSLGSECGGLGKKRRRGRVHDQAGQKLVLTPQGVVMHMHMHMHGHIYNKRLLVL